MVQTAFEPIQIKIKPKKVACQYLTNIAKKLCYVPICEKVYQKKPDPKLIFSAKRSGLSAQTIVNLFQWLYASAGIQGASSHSGRMQFVAKIVDQGINARLVQTLARHKVCKDFMSFHFIIYVV